MSRASSRRTPIRFFAGAVAAALVAAFAVGVAGATVVLRCDVEALTDLCHGAVYGTVAATSVENDRAKGQIWTNHTIRVDETWLGDAAADVTVSVPGGTSDGITQEFQGGAELTKGDRAAVFVWRRDDGRLLVLGEAQGAFRVRRDATTGEDRCENSIAGLAFVDHAGKTVEAAPANLSLAALRTRVADARKAREARELAVREERARRLAERVRRAEANDRLTRGKPGGAPGE